MNTENSTINENSKQGAFGLSMNASRWSFFDTAIQKILSFGTFFVLARILYPEDFGIITLILIAPSLLDLLSNLNFESAMIQQKENNPVHLNATWTFNVLRGAIIAILVFLLAPFIAKFFNIEQAIGAIRLSGLIIFIQGLTNVAQLYFFKDIDFKKIFWRDISMKTAYSLSTIGLAFVLHSYWALLFGTLIQYSVSTISTYVLHSYRPRLCFKFKALGELLDYSVWVYGQNLLAQITTNFEDILVGKTAGVTGLGLYGKAKSLAGGPITPISSMISKIGFPAFSKIQDAKEKITEGISKSLDVLMAISFPFMAAVLLGGNKIVLIMLGERWIDIVPAFKILTIGVTINVLTSIASPLFNAIGKPKISFTLDVLFTTSFVVSLILLTPSFGIIGAAWALVISATMILIFTIALAYKFEYIDLRRIIYSMLVTIISTSITAFIGSQFLSSSFFNNNFGFLVIVGSLGILYCLLLYISGKYFKKGPSETIIEALKEFLRL